MKPFFSIIIPTLNEERYLPRLLEDLKKQKYRSFEVIIVDAQSKDKTIDVAKAYSNTLPHLRIIESPERNLCYQRNFGADNAKGDYYIFLDADIQVFTDYLQEIHKEIKESNAKFLTTYQLPDVKSKIDIYLVQFANYTLEMLAMINKQMAPGYNFIVKKDIFNKAGKFDNNASFSEDHDLSMRIGKKTHIKIRIVRKNLLKWSFRRIRKNGRIPIIFKYTLAAFQTMIFGKITDKNFSYPMGGEYFKDLGKIKQQPLLDYIKKFKRILED